VVWDIPFDLSKPAATSNHCLPVVLECGGSDDPVASDRRTQVLFEQQAITRHKRLVHAKNKVVRHEACIQAHGSADVARVRTRSDSLDQLANVRSGDQCPRRIERIVGPLGADAQVTLAHAIRRDLNPNFRQAPP
jgi:hypothetical protein